MRPITFDKTCYWVGDRPIYLNSGEFHYFRVPKTDWQRRMELFKMAGGNTLATYIPWLIHEPEEGRFVFDAGDGITDLEAFLALAEAMELYVIARPGPYQYSELIYGGLPGWLFDRYPAVQARTLAGEPFGLPSASYLHPVFLEKARAWFGAVCPILARHTVSQGGPIAFTQIDNELMGIHVWFGGMDYHPETMGFGDPDGRYPRFLQRRYETIARLNARYDTAYTSFAEARPLAPSEGSGRPASVRRLRDYFEFYLSVTTEYALTLAGWMRELGIDGPLLHNSANPGMNAYFVEMVAAFGDDLLLGSDHYYNLSQSWPQNNPTPQYARNVFVSNEQLRLLGYPPTILELPSGSASDWPPITPGDAKACYMANLAMGMKGHNYYVFTGGPNPPGVGETTDMYDYGAPIGPHGRVRPLYHVQAEVGAFIRKHPSLVEAEAAYDCRVALSFADARADRYWRDRGSLLFSPADAWRFTLEGLITTAFCASLSPRGVDLDADDWVADTGTPLMVGGSEVMPAAQQQRLVRFLENGGRLLIGPVLPSLDGDLDPCTVLRDFLGGPGFARRRQAVIRVVIQGPTGDVVNVLKNEVFFTEGLPETAEIVGYDEITSAPLAWQIETPGGGQALVLGMSWDHRKQEQAQALQSLLARLGLEQAIVCSNPNVWATLRTAGDHGILFLANLFAAPMKTDVRYRSGPGGQVDLGQFQIAPMTVETVDVSV